MNTDIINTALDTGLGAIALMYVHRVGKVLEKHEVRLVKLERRKRRT